MTALWLKIAKDRMELDPQLAEVWLSGPGRIFPLSQATHAMAIMVRTLILAGRPSPTIWVPNYFCNGALLHARTSPVRLRFYPIDDNMQPDWTECARMAASDPPDLFALAHYFGVANLSEAARRFCDVHGALLLEDAVHVMRPVGRIGEVGDFVTYSPRKYFDLPDGGILVVRGTERASLALDAAMTLPPKRPPTVGWSLRALRPRLGIRTGPLQPVAIDDQAPQPTPQTGMWMSTLSRTRLRRLHREGSFERIADRERFVQSEIARAVSGLYGLQPLGAHPDATPYMFAMRGVDEGSVAIALSELRRAGAMTATWPALPPEVLATPYGHGAALRVRRTLLRFIPRPASRRRPLDFLAALPRQSG